jgi:hypothetical protein
MIKIYWIFLLLVIGCGNKNPNVIIQLQTNIQSKMEYAYYEGQKDAIEGKIRIKKISDSQYVWIKSPWDGGKEPVFHPPINSVTDTIHGFGTVLNSDSLKKEYW